MSEAQQIHYLGESLIAAGPDPVVVLGCDTPLSMMLQHALVICLACDLLLQRILCMATSGTERSRISMKGRLGPCCLRWTSGATNRWDILACCSNVQQCVPLTALRVQCCMTRAASMDDVVSPAPARVPLNLGTTLANLPSAITVWSKHYTAVVSACLAAGTEWGEALPL